MPEDDKKVLPKDFDSDYSIPGRFEESNSEYFDTEYYDAEPIKSKPKNRTILVIAVAFMIISSGFFAYYFINQNEIDSRIIQNAINIDPENKLVNQYGVGEYGSDHEHAAIAIFVDGIQVNFGLPQFQITSKYIHFENNNPYLIHKHATSVPLEMLFASFEMKITQDCIIFHPGKSVDIKTGKYCTDKDQSLTFYVNGEEYYSDISQYEIEHNDRILISVGEIDNSKHLKYLESLKIFDVPEKSNISNKEIFI